MARKMAKPRTTTTRGRLTRTAARRKTALPAAAAATKRLLDELEVQIAAVRDLTDQLKAVRDLQKQRLERGGLVPAAIKRPKVARRRLPSTLSFAEGLGALVIEDERLVERARRLEQDVRVTVLPRTRSGKTLRDARGLPQAQAPIDDYRPDEVACASAERFLESNGLQVLRRGRFGITAKGTAEQVKRVLDVDLRVFAMPRRESARSVRAFAQGTAPPHPDDLFVAPVESINVRFGKDGIDDLQFLPPPTYFGTPAAIPPTPAYHHLQEAQLRRLLNVPTTATGAAIRVAVVDTGFYPHPYYAAKGYRLTPRPTAVSPAPEQDDNGHGTAIALNVFAVAPGCEVLGIQKTDVVDALEEAADSADVISCSWGWPFEQSFSVVEKTVQAIVAEGKIVLFAAGNGQQSWPATMPEVIAVGGVYADETSALEASSYASGFVSSLYTQRRVPDVSGLCGQAPRGIYIVMPCPPRSRMDADYGGAPFPDHDTTTVDDGWLAASGTSSATPQVAGVVALMLEKARAGGRTLDAAGVRSILEQTSRPVTTGRNAFGFPAAGHPNVAVGYGLVDATAALALV
jgi:serine protease AprX